MPAPSGWRPASCWTKGSTLAGPSVKKNRPRKRPRCTPSRRSPRAWLAKTAADRAASTQDKNTAWLERNIFPVIGALPISTIKPWDVLGALRLIEKRGAIESAHKIKQLCGQVFRFAEASGLADRDMNADLRGALPAVPEAHYAAIIDPKEAAELLSLSTLTKAMLVPLSRSSWRPLSLFALGSCVQRRVVRDRPRRGRMAHTRLQHEDGAGSYRAAGKASPRTATGPARDDGTWHIRIPQRPYWLALHDREHYQRGLARYGLQQGCDDRSRLPRYGAHDHE